MSEKQEKRDSDPMSVIVFIIGALGGFYLKNVKDAVFRAKTWMVELAMVAVSWSAGT